MASFATNITTELAQNRNLTTTVNGDQTNMQIVTNNYDVIVVDPPWAYGSGGAPSRTAESHYKTIGNNGKEINRKTGAGIDSIIKSVPVEQWSAKNSHLYLWATNPKLPFAFDVMRAWGFEYKTTLTWVKTAVSGAPIRSGMGWFFRGATEHVLFGVRGNKPIAPALRQPNILLAGRGEHSEKPDEFYRILDAIYSPGDRRIDVFARRVRAGWDAYGNELGESIVKNSGPLQK